MCGLSLQDSNSGTGGWLRLTVQKVAGKGSVSLVQVKGPNTSWQNMNNYWGASWEISSSPGLPMDMRIQSSDGTEVPSTLRFLLSGLTANRTQHLSVWILKCESPDTLKAVTCLQHYVKSKF